VNNGFHSRELKLELAAAQSKTFQFGLASDLHQVFIQLLQAQSDWQAEIESALRDSGVNIEDSSDSKCQAFFTCLLSMIAFFYFLLRLFSIIYFFQNNVCDCRTIYYIDSFDSFFVFIFVCFFQAFRNIFGIFTQGCAKQKKPLMS